MTNDEPTSYDFLLTLGLDVLMFTILLSFMYWMEEILAALEAVPTIYYIAFFALWIGASALALIQGGEGTRELGAVGLGAFVFAFGFASIGPVARFLAGILEHTLPTWPPNHWVVLGVGSAVFLFAFGVVGSIKAGGLHE